MSNVKKRKAQGAGERRHGPVLAGWGSSAGASTEASAPRGWDQNKTAGHTLHLEMCHRLGVLQPLVQEVSGGWWWAMKMMQYARNTGCFFSCITAVDICWQHHADGQERKLGISVAGHRYPASRWGSQRLAQCDLPACAVPDWHHEARETTSICAETWRLITEACTGKGLINQTHVMWAARACGLVIYPQTPISTRNSSAFWICLSSCMLTRHEIAT